MRPSALAAFAWAVEVLAARLAGRAAPADAPDWLCLEALSSIALEPGPEPRLRVQLRDGVAAAAVGRRLRHGPGRGLRLTVRRGAPARAQASAPPGLTLQRTLEQSTATALVRDRLNPERQYLLTCSHGVAPDAGVRFGDRVRIDTGLEGLLREWQPDPAPDRPSTSMDAALVEIDAGTRQALQDRGTDWWPRTLDDGVQVGRPVSLRRRGGPLGGTLTMPWAGELTAAGGLRYLLQEGFVYETPSPTVGGDSGAALWADGDALLGMHLGLLDDATGRPAQALMARVKPALDWFCVKPFTRLDPATLGPGDWPPSTIAARAPGRVAHVPAMTVPTAPGVDPEDHLVLAQTLWGEARGEGWEGMKAVAAVVMNRARTGYRGQHRAADVCRDPWQFSCWNAADPNAEAMRRVAAGAASDPVFRDALDVAAIALQGRLADPTTGSRHYVATSLRFLPDWLHGKRPVIVIGRHAFYNDVD
jgi:hypothetical protein